MIYVVGSGRCGTMTYAKLHGGMHEPNPTIVEEVCRHYAGDSSIKRELAMKLYDRFQLNTELISDHHQTLCLDLIDAMDDHAEYVWLVREPVSCARSWFYGGAYNGSNDWWERNRIRPRDGFTDTQKKNRYLMIGWYWLEMNRVIDRFVEGKRYTVVFTDELGKVVYNSSMQRSIKTGEMPEEPRDMNKVEKEYFDKVLTPYWNELNLEYRKDDSSDSPA